MKQEACNGQLLLLLTVSMAVKCQPPARSDIYGNVCKIEVHGTSLNLKKQFKVLNVAKLITGIEKCSNPSMEKICIFQITTMQECDFDQQF